MQSFNKLNNTKVKEINQIISSKCEKKCFVNANKNDNKTSNGDYFADKDTQHHIKIILICFIIAITP